MPYQHPSGGLEYVNPADGPSALGVEVEPHNTGISPADLQSYFWDAEAGVSAHGEQHQHPSDDIVEQVDAPRPWAAENEPHHTFPRHLQFRHPGELVVVPALGERCTDPISYLQNQDSALLGSAEHLSDAAVRTSYAALPEDCFLNIDPWNVKSAFGPL